MKKITLLLGVFLMSCASLLAQAPANCGDIMLQGFYWDSYKSTKYGNTKWTILEDQASEIAETFSMIWLPPSATQEFGGGMGYHPRQYSDQNSSWGKEAELKSLLSTLNSKGCKPIADIVVNHKSGCSTATDLCPENFGTHGTFPGDWSMVCKNDEYPGGGGYDTGENWHGARDLDHTNSKTRDMIKAYLKWLKDLGYKGWRYDVAKGFSGSYVGEYNSAANASFSVGEYMDGDYSKLTGWVEATGKRSTVFDFCLKYSGFNNGLAAGNYQALAGYGGGCGMIGDSKYKQYAVTFIDNHDTFERDDATQQFQGDCEQANAYILAMPGIPCVYWPHWNKCKTAIKSMAAARKACGITNTSSANCEATAKYFKGTITGSKGTLICFIGSGWSDPAGYTKACNGNGWAYYTSTAVNPNPNPNPNPTPTPTPDPTPGGTGYSLYVNGKDLYNMEDQGAWDIDNSYNQFALPNVSLNAGDTFVFYNNANGETWGSVTVDNASITDITGDGSKFTVAADGCYSVYLKLKFQQDNVYFGVGTDCSAAPTPTPTPDPDPDPTPDPDPVPTPDPTPGGSITLKVKASSLPWGNKCYLYTWDGGELGAEIKYTGEWPGTAMTLGSDGFYTYTVNQSMVYAIFTDGSASGTLQTDDIQNITTSTCYELSSEQHENMLGAMVYDAIETACPEPVSIIETEAVELNIYPNPTNDYINVDCAEEICEVVISALNGSEVIRTKSTYIDLSSLTPSMYFVNIMLQNGDVVRSKVIRK